MLGKVVGGDEGQDMGFQGFQVFIMERLDGAVHALGLAIGLRMIGLGQAIFDVVLSADAVEDVTEAHGGWACAVLGQIGEGHAVVGQDRMDFVRKDPDDVPQEGRPFIFPALSWNST